MDARRVLRFALVGMLLAGVALPALAWDGTDENGNAVEIEQDNLVRTGSDIEYYNYADGNYHDATVDSISRDGDEVVIEVTDDDTGYAHTLTMEDDG